MRQPSGVSLCASLYMKLYVYANIINVNSVASAPSASDRVSLAGSLVLRVKNYFIQLSII